MKCLPASLCAVLALLPLSSRAYTGSRNSEAILSFDGKIRIESSGAPAASEARTDIEVQLKHLFGAMAYSRRKAAPRNVHSIEIVSTLPVKGSEETYEVAYRYSGTIALADGSNEDYPIYLPLRPRSVAAEAVSRNDAETPNACTNDSDPDPRYFWYYWSPERRGCRLIEGIDYFKASGTIVRKDPRDPEKDKTYPEYARLVQVRDGKKVIPISILIGKFDVNDRGGPLASDDLGAKQYAKIRAQLLAMKFVESKIAKKEMKAIAKAGKKGGEIRKGKLISGYPFALLFEKDTPEGTIEIRLLYGDSSEEAAHAFFVLYQDSLKRDAMMIYDGHSGLGDYLSLDNLRKNRGMTPVADPSIYQIYYFNSCTSYAYYNDSYLRWKASPKDPTGTKQLDILTNGLATGYPERDTNMVLVKAVHEWATTGNGRSYWAITNQLNFGNLIGVNGDEDNARP